MADTWLSLRGESFCFGRGSIADMRVSSLAIIEDLDVIKQIPFCLIVGLIVAVVDALDLH